MTTYKFIDKKSKEIFSYLSQVFDYKLGISEVGITDYLVFELTKYLKTNNISNIEILKITSNIECIFGNDIDIFLELPSGGYIWNTFQAKVLSYNGAFKDLINKNKTPQQWEKLLFHERIFGSKSFYLLYSGQPKIKTKQISGTLSNSDCLGNPNFDELGLSIIEANKIKAYRNGKKKQMTYLNHLFPNKIKAFREIFCPINISNTGKTYSKSQIYRTDIYDKIILSKMQEKYKDIEKLDSFDELEKFTAGAGKIRIIINQD